MQADGPTLDAPPGRTPLFDCVMRRALTAFALVVLLIGCNHVTVWTPPQVPGADPPEVVVIVHAIWRWPGYSMRRLVREGVARGYEVVYFRYSGLLADLDTNTQRLADFLQDYRGRQINFVTHSYGGLIVRNLLWNFRIPNVHRFVMIATPNQGSNFADTWCRSLPYRLIFGLGGTQLTSAGARRIGVPDVEYGIIAGSGSGINPWAPGANDGVVGVSEAYLPGAREFRVVDGMHEALPNKPRVVRAVYNFLETGSFGLDPTQ
jgi:triacylglycerol lipase